MKKIINNFLIRAVFFYKLLKIRFSVARFSELTPLAASNFSNDNKTCVVIGNGPSLKEDIVSILEMTNVDFFCVNHMAESEHFQILKPNKYTLLDGYFWAGDAHETLKIKRQKLFDMLNSKVSWNMCLYIPRAADLEYLKTRITNTNINIVKYMTIPIEGVNYKDLPNLLLKGKYGPPAYNVIIYATYLSIIAGYDKIELYGADLSFTEDVVLDQATNQLSIEYKHFYGQSTFEPLLQNPQRIIPFTMESLYKTTYLTFYAHNLLNKMALIKGTKIINRSSYSLIDAYERN